MIHLVIIKEKKKKHRFDEYKINKISPSITSWPFFSNISMGLLETPCCYSFQKIIRLQKGMAENMTV